MPQIGYRQGDPARVAVTLPMGAELTNKIALWLGSILFLSICADLVLNNAAGSMFLARKFLDLIDYVSFWR